MKTVKIILGILMVLLAANPVLADKFWDAGGSDNSWLTPENWDNDTLPPDGERVFLDIAGATVWVPSGETVLPRRIIGPCWDSTGVGTVTVDGELTNDSYWYMGYEAGATGVLNVNGTVNTRDLKVAGGDGYAGIINVTGLLNIYGDIADTGAYFGNDSGTLYNGTVDVNVDGGTLQITQLADMGANAVMDIVNGGQIIFVGDQTSLVNSYIGTDQILVNGSSSNVQVSTFEDGGVTYTRVVPEPASMCLLATGLIFLGRKK